MKLTSFVLTSGPSSEFILFDKGQAEILFRTLIFLFLAVAFLLIHGSRINRPTIANFKIRMNMNNIGIWMIVCYISIIFFQVKYCHLLERMLPIDLPQSLAGNALMTDYKNKICVNMLGICLQYLFVVKFQKSRINTFFFYVFTACLLVSGDFVLEAIATVSFDKPYSSATKVILVRVVIKIMLIVVLFWSALHSVHHHDDDEDKEKEVISD